MPDHDRVNISDLTTAYQTGERSAEETLAETFARIEAHDTCHAIVELCPETALAEARRADAAHAEGRSLGPLHGVPVTVKMNIDMAGHATTNGVPQWQDRIARTDAPVIERLRAAGAIVVGRTNAAAMSFGLFTDNPLYGPTLNPWDETLTPGGSSGGAAVSVATGLVPLAHCNDSGGSIRYPALCCGVAGLRPTFGRVAARNATAPTEPSIMAQLVLANGLIASSVEDLAVGLVAISGRHPDDPWSVDAPDDPIDAARPCRVAVLETLPGVHADTEQVDAVRYAADWLTDAGYDVEARALPSFEEASFLRDRLLLHEVRHDTLASIRTLATPEQANEATALIEATPEITFEEFRCGMARRTSLIREWTYFLATYPIVLTPTTWSNPMRIGTYAKPVTLTPANVLELSPLHVSPLLGLPALSVPTGVPGGIPAGVHLMASRFEEARLIAAGRVIEKHCGLLRPPVPTAVREGLSA